MKKAPAKKEKPAAQRPLTPQQDRFCHEYIRDYNGTQAAIRAKYSAKTAEEQASRLLSKVIVRGRVNQLIEDQFKEIKLDVNRVLRGLLKAAEIDIRMAYDEEGKLLPIKDMPEPLAKVIMSMETEELFDGRGKDKKHIGTAKTIKITDRIKAWELLGKHKKMFTDVVQHDITESLAERIKQARMRTKQCKSSPQKKR